MRKEIDERRRRKIENSKRPNSRQTRSLKQAQKYIKGNLFPKDLHYNRNPPKGMKKSSAPNV